MPFIDHNGKLAYTPGWYTESQRPVESRNVYVSKIDANDYAWLLDTIEQQIEWTGNQGIVYRPGRRPATLDAGDWERIFEERPIKKPRRGKRQGQPYDWEWKWGRWVRKWL